MNELISSAENGDPKSQYHLAVLYHDGKELPKDYVQAAYWYRKAAEQGHVKAQLYLGLLYSRGFGVPRNYDEAVKWLTLSSQQGNDKAKILLDDVISERDSESEGNETNSPSKTLILITSAVIILSVIIIVSALFFMDRTNDVISSLPVKTLPSNEDDLFSPPVSSAYSPYIFSLTEPEPEPEPRTEARQEDPERNIQSGRQQVEKLLKSKKVSPFVRDTGTFEFNADYDGGRVEITGSNVRMRKQPNTKSRIIKTVNQITSGESLKYLGEWTSPKGDKWVVCAYKDNPKVRDVDAKVVWIFSEYTRLIREDDNESVIEDTNVN